MWWLNGLHHEVASVPAGTFATLAEDFRDGQGDTRRSVQVSLVDVTPSTGGPDGSLTLRGTDAYAVRLDFRAAPDQELRPCKVALIGADGQRYDVPMQPASPCLPQDHPGPEASIVQGQPRGVVTPGEERPASWQVAPIVVTDEGARPVAVRVWFSFPRYVELRLPS